MSDSLRPHGLYSPWDSPGQNIAVGSRSQGVFPTQGSIPGLPQCRWILYHLSHQGNLRILEWVVYPFSRGSFQPRSWTGISCIAGGFFTSWATREALVYLIGSDLGDLKSNILLSNRSLFFNSPFKTFYFCICMCLSLINWSETEIRIVLSWVHFLIIALFLFQEEWFLNCMLYSIATDCRTH